jgi:sarcosine oxidase, subunit gamma
MLEINHVARRIMSLPAAQAAGAGAPAAVVIRPLAAQARFSLRLHADDAASVGTAAGFRLDIPINRRVGTAEQSAARLGPNEWLLIGLDGDADLIAGGIEAALDGRFHALVDIGHRNVGIQVSGPRAADVLNSGCPLDLAEAAFPTGMATRTLLGKAEIVLMRLDDAPTYQVECWRSFSSYVHDYLSEAAREFAPSAR